jgi:aromatic-L-amino-acid decarboxylase
MTPEEFRRHGYAAVDWIADYMTNVADRPVVSEAAPGDVRAALPPHPPEKGEPFENLLSDLDDIILPGITHWQHPGFFGFFPANASGPAILGDLLTGGLNVVGMLWWASPAATELEEHVMDWMADLLDLPERFRSGGPGGGVIQDTASSAVLVVLLAALNRVTGGRARAEGVSGRFAVYGSDQAHSALEKNVRVAGLGESAMRLVRTDPATLAMDPEHLRELIEADVRDGVLPVMVMATVGSTSTTAVDPVPRIGALCREFGIWLHIDAAFAGVAAVCPEFRWIHEGVSEFADSYCTNPHKWMLTTVGSSTLWVADRGAVIEALSILPAFLRNRATESGQVVDYRDWQIPLGRTFRALKLWAVLRWYGAEGVRAHVRHHVALAQEFALWVTDDERFELVAPHPLSLVCFRMRGADSRTERLLELLNADGRIFVSQTRVNGHLAIRFAIGATTIDTEHVATAWQVIRDLADRAGTCEMERT